MSDVTNYKHVFPHACCAVHSHNLSRRRQLHRLTLYHKINTSEHLPEYVTSLMPNTRARDTDRRLRNANTHTTSTCHTSTYKRSFLPTTTRQWNRLTRDTQQLSHIHFKKEICQQLGAPAPPKYYCMGSKIGNIFHSRLRMKMSHLNSHLFIIKKVNSPECTCGYDNENIEHFLFYCPKYATERNDLINDMSQILGIDFMRLSVKQRKHIFE